MYEKQIHLSSISKSFVSHLHECVCYKVYQENVLELSNDLVKHNKRINDAVTALKYRLTATTIDHE